MRGLKAAKHENAFGYLPTSWIDECHDFLKDAAVFSTLDCSSGYWKIPIAERDNVCYAPRHIPAHVDALRP